MKSQGVDEDDVVEAADKLWAKEFNKPSRLLGIAVEELKNDVGIQNPLARELSNKLSQQQNALSQAGFRILLRECGIDIDEEVMRVIVKHFASS